MSVTIRLLDHDDLDILLRADETVFDHAIDPRLARAYLAHPDYLIALALDGDIVVGMTSGLFYFHPDKPLEFFVNEVGVAQSHQRRGIAKQLVQTVLGAAKTRGADYAWVGTERDNDAAKALYRSLGGKGQDMAYYEFNLSENPEKSNI